MQMIKLFTADSDQSSDDANNKLAQKLEHGLTPLLAEGWEIQSQQTQLAATPIAYSRDGGYYPATVYISLTVVLTRPEFVKVPSVTKG